MKNLKTFTEKINMVDKFKLSHEIKNQRTNNMMFKAYKK